LNHCNNCSGRRKNQKVIQSGKDILTRDELQFHSVYTIWRNHTFDGGIPLAKLLTKSPCVNGLYPDPSLDFLLEDCVRYLVKLSAGFVPSPPCFWVRVCKALTSIFTSGQFGSILSIVSASEINLKSIGLMSYIIRKVISPLRALEYNPLALSPWSRHCRAFIWSGLMIMASVFVSCSRFFDLFIAKMGYNLVMILHTEFHTHLPVSIQL